MSAIWQIGRSSDAQGACVGLVHDRASHLLQAARSEPCTLLSSASCSVWLRCRSAMQVHQLVEKANIVREGWNGYNVMHDSASRVAALDLGFLPSARSATAPPPKFVYLLGADDYAEDAIPEDAFVVYQVSSLADNGRSSVCARLLMLLW